MYAYFINGKQHQQREKPTHSDGDWWLHFDEAAHTYTDSNGVRYMSATAFVASLHEPFNAMQAAIECASSTADKWQGLDTADAVLGRWEDQANEGSKLHAAIEEMICKCYNQGDNLLYQPLIEQFCDWANIYRCDNKMRSEVILWSRSLCIAGTCDILTACKDEIILDDVKTYSKLDYDRQTKAAEQLTLYAMMVEEMTGHAAQVGGIVLYENYYELRNKCVMRFVEMKDRRDQMQPAIWAREYKVRAKKEGEEMALNITNGAGHKPARVVVYGTEGIGKSTFASRFPKPVFIDTEGSTVEMDVQRLETPRDWQAVIDLLRDVYAEDSVPFKTLVIDTVDWLEKACAAMVAKSKGKKNLADIGYGKGELALAEEFKRLLDGLDAIQSKHNLHIVLTAHSWVKHFDPPDMPEGFDRYELKLTKHVAPLVREWCSMLLFANFSSQARKTDSGKAKGVGDGNTRYIYTQRTDAFDAKNRHNMEPVYRFAYSEIAPFIEGTETVAATEEGDK